MNIRSTTFHILILLLGFLGVGNQANAIPLKATYPAFQIGVTGARVSIQPGHIMTVEEIAEGSPADGRLKAGDIIHAVNGKAIKGKDPRVPLGAAITKAEASNGVLKFSITRDSKQGDVIIRIPVLGTYSETWPLVCDKSQHIIDAHAKWLVSNQADDGYFGKGAGLEVTMGAIFLLSLDDQAYDKNVERFAHHLSADVQKNPSGSAWHLGYHLIFLCEYYLKTGDESVIPAIEAACKRAAESQEAGAWGHYTNRGVNPGYVQSGLMNSAGVTLFLGITLARECGVTLHEEAFQRALVFFYRMVGHGSICYGDHRAEIFAATNGRNAAIACAFSLLDQEPYENASQHLAMMVADSYSKFEKGHTGGGFNVLWRGIALTHLPEAAYASRRREHMEQLTWYYDLTRRYEGGFSMLPTSGKRYTGEAWGRGLGLTYTAPQRTLRITGAPRTEHSKPTRKLEKLPWGNKRDLVFLSSKHAKGFGKDTLLAHEVNTLVQSKEPVPAKELSRYLRHYNPFIRTHAAWKLGKMHTDEAYDEIQLALQHEDARVRRAACDAISGIESWGRGKIGLGIPREVVSKRFARHLDVILNDHEAAWWEIDGALWALATALPQDIRRNRKTIDKYGQHDEWYLRESAYWALAGLGKAINGEEFLSLAERFNRSVTVFERSSMNAGIIYLLRRERAEFEPEVVAEYVKSIADQLYDAMIAHGYNEFSAKQDAAHRTMMVLSEFKNPPYELIAKNFATYIEGWKPGNQHGDWLITGNRWQPGLSKIAIEMGKDAGPLVDQFKRALAQDYWDPKSKSTEGVRNAMQSAIDHYDKVKDNR